MKRLLAGIVLVAAILAVSEAADGFAVSIDVHDLPKSIDPGTLAMELDSAPARGRNLLGYRIVANRPQEERVLCRDVCIYPKINVEGTRVAFYRKDTAGKWHLSLVNVDGSALQDLLDLQSRCNALIAWPRGDWVYYHKPSATRQGGTAEIWKVNVKDPKQNSKVWSAEDRIVRFSLAADGRRAAIRAFPGMGNNGYDIWPPQSVTDHVARPVGESFEQIRGDEYTIARCNIQVSPSGGWVATYFHYNHMNVSIHSWSFATNQVSGRKEVTSRADQAAWSGQSVSGKGKYIRYSSNSDKWLSEICSAYRTFDYGNVITNWVDGEAISLGEYRMPGDFWVQPPAGEEGKIQLADGSWVSTGNLRAQPGLRAGRAGAMQKAAPPVRPIPSLGLSGPSQVTVGLREETFDIRGRILPSTQR